jgi:hypothetical protein
LPQATYPRTVRAVPVHRSKLFFYLVLLQVGFTVPQLLPVARCALTAPFHPYQTIEK